MKAYDEIREIYLLENQSIELLEGEHGRTVDIKGDNFSIRVFIDLYNRRLVTREYVILDYNELVMALDSLCQKNSLTKIFMKVKEQDWIPLLSYGFVLEGVFQKFYNGEDAYSIAKYYSKERRCSSKIDEEDLIIEEVIRKPKVSKEAPIPSEYTIRKAMIEDIPQLVQLYKQVFKTYPTPIDNPSYIKKAMEEHVIFMIIEHEGQIISAASADIDFTNGNAEMTDCATDPGYRGRGLMNSLMYVLEKEMKQRNIGCLYTIARARSYGMNAVFHYHGYQYTGRLINNCDISGQFEDMNIWSKWIGA